MERFEILNARQFMLGLQWHEAASIIHRAEEQSRVPYRYFKRFTGHLLDNGQEIGAVSEVFYVRAWEPQPIFNYKPASERIRKTASYRNNQTPEFFMEAADTGDILTQAAMLLEEDPYIFVENRAEMIDWSKEKKVKEITSLSEQERCFTVDDTRDGER